MATAPTFDIPQRLDLVQGRTRDWSFDLYEATGAPLVISALDNVRAKLWITDAASPAIEAESLTPGTSFVTVNTVGVVNTTPARVTVRWDNTDTAGLTAGNVYKWELLLVDQSDGSEPKTICMGTALIRGAATGDVSL
jgi:hypothetical protein